MYGYIRPNKVWRKQYNSPNSANFSPFNFSSSTIFSLPASDVETVQFALLHVQGYYSYKLLYSYSESYSTGDVQAGAAQLGFGCNIILKVGKNKIPVRQKASNNQKC